ncbi:Hypothetical predicted protein [Paramuricea clavata]|uniref:Uncharacterized protein n=2 Tax=Paramuricea clavata TaxID=317549 RepID=A0A7D9IUA9_PARCT|nr:Hypothetical predicted protein [Paramuricea clavata]
MTCDVNIEVEVCECPTQTVNGVIGPSRTQGLASWEIPEPTCPAEPKQPIPEFNGLFTKGEHTVQYVYTHKSASNTFDITCDVNINMEACKCPPVQTFKEILRPDESKAFVTWQEPTPNCEVTLESSDSTAPDGLFTVGKHTRQYTYSHETGFNMTCDVNIEVEVCECPTQTVNGVIGPSRTQGLASWEIPEPTCPAEPKQPIPEFNGLFTEGEHTVQYVYTHKSASNTFDITCDVNINMEACKCPPVQTFKEILRPDASKAFVTWQEPTPNCEVTLESSDSTAPDGLFTVGKHTRQYTYRHETGFSMTCDVNIEVEACECPTQTVNGVIGPSRTQGLASWEIPEPTCPAHPKQPIPEPKGLFTEGEHTVQYVYTHKSASNTFDITCDVNINMEACKCPPVQTFQKTISPGESKAFVTWQEPTPNCEVTLESSDSTAPDGLFTLGKYTRQYTYHHEAGFSMTCDVNIEVEGELCRGKAINPDTEVCCCGEVHRAQSGYKCCGVEYYNTLAHECCDETRANIVPKGERCPNAVYYVK